MCTNCLCSLKWMCTFYIQLNNFQHLFIKYYDKITTKNMHINYALNNTRSKIIIGLKWNTSNNFCSSKTIIPPFYTSKASTDQPLCFKSFIIASHQSVVNINIIMKFLIGHKAFVSLCNTLPYIIHDLTNSVELRSWCQQMHVFIHSTWGLYRKKPQFNWKIYWNRYSKCWAIFQHKGE